MKWTDSMCGYVAECLAESGAIKKSEKEIYAYCFGFLADLIVYNLSILLIGAVLGRFQIALLYILIMSPTKMLAGGVHAPTPLICDLVSYGAFLTVILTVPRIATQIPPFLLLSIYFLCYIFIILLSPVSTKNKRYTEAQKRRLKKYCFLYLTAVSILYLIFFANQMPVHCGIFSACAAIILANQILGIIVNVKESHYDLENSNV